MIRITLRRLGVVTMLTLTAFACSSDPQSTADGSTGGDQGIDQGIAAGRGILKGKITSADGSAVGDATVKVGTVSTTADFRGVYELSGVAAGEATVVVKASWFADKQQTAQVTADETTTLDITLDAAALKVDPADRTLAEDYLKTADWTKDTLSIQLVEAPTKRALENAVFFRNPALYRDTSTTPALSPDAKPTIGSSGAKNFDFVVGTEQVLVAASVVDEMSAMGLSDTGKWVTWGRMISLLRAWDPAKVASLSNASAVVRQQQWGGDAFLPQQLERVWIDGGEIWVSLVFEPFVELGAGISDTDGDGRKEVYGKLTASLYTKEIVDKVLADYVDAPKLDTLQLKELVDDVVSDLYNATNPEILSTVGQPYDLPSGGQLAYPFVVLKHPGQEGAPDKINALLVAP